MHLGVMGLGQVLFFQQHVITGSWEANANRVCVGRNDTE